MSTDLGRLELVVYTGEVVTVRPLPPGAKVRVGRADDNDIRLSDAAVSRYHAVIHNGPPAEVEDLGSANGTQVNTATRRSSSGDTLTLAALRARRQALAIGDSIVLGATVIALRRASAAAATDEVVLAEPAMKRLYDQCARASQGALAVLILGETGTGKEVLARHVHKSSPRSKKSYLALNCAAISESLLEGELFGYERGAFTGAVQQRVGLIESADGGTLFLDEIGDLPMPTQIKLLRVLEQKEVMRLGARAPKRVDVRFVSATNKDLEAESAAGRFRQDLYFRLNGISFTIPPLRERPADIVALSRRFLDNSVLTLDRGAPPEINPLAMSALESYSWPGNVRELRNVIERAVVLADDVITLEHLPKKLVDETRVARAGVARNAEKRAVSAEGVQRLRSEMAEAERQAIVDALEKCDGNQSRAAELLGISRRTLLHRLDEYGIDRPRKR